MANRLYDWPAKPQALPRGWQKRFRRNRPDPLSKRPPARPYGQGTQPAEEASPVERAVAGWEEMAEKANRPSRPLGGMVRLRDRLNMTAATAFQRGAASVSPRGADGGIGVSATIPPAETAGTEVDRRIGTLRAEDHAGAARRQAMLRRRGQLGGFAGGGMAPVRGEEGLLEEIEGGNLAAAVNAPPALHRYLLSPEGRRSMARGRAAAAPVAHTVENDPALAARVQSAQAALDAKADSGVPRTYTPEQRAALDEKHKAYRTRREAAGAAYRQRQLARGRERQERLEDTRERQQLGLTRREHTLLKEQRATLEKQLTSQEQVAMNQVLARVTGGGRGGFDFNSLLTEPGAMANLMILTQTAVSNPAILNLLVEHAPEVGIPIRDAMREAEANPDASLTEEQVAELESAGIGSDITSALLTPSSPAMGMSAFLRLLERVGWWQERKVRTGAERHTRVLAAREAMAARRRERAAKGGD